MSEPIGTKIRRLRKRAGLTQTELALRIGVTQPALSQIEKGRTSPKLDTLADIAEVLDCEIDLADKDSRDLTERQRRFIDLATEAAHLLDEDALSHLQMMVQGAVGLSRGRHG